MKAPHTVREALMAEVLGDLDKLLTRIEGFPELIISVEEKLTHTVAALNDAGNKYRIAVNTFNEQAKKDLAHYLDTKTASATSKAFEEQSLAIQKAAHTAFNAEILNKAANLSIVLKDAANEFRKSTQIRIIEHAITALIASCFTACLVYAIVKNV